MFLLLTLALKSSKRSVISALNTFKLHLTHQRKPSMRRTVVIHKKELKLKNSGGNQSTTVPFVRPRLVLITARNQSSANATAIRARDFRTRMSHFFHQAWVNN